MKMKVYQVTEKDVPEIVAFQNSYYPVKRTEEQWFWEYFKLQPSLSVFMVMKIDKHIIGTQGMIPISLNISGQIVLSGKSESSLLDLNYRGKQLFQELYETALSRCKEKGMEIIWGFTNAVKVWKNSLGFVVFENEILSGSLILKPIEVVKAILQDSSLNFHRRMVNSIRVFFRIVRGKLSGFRRKKEGSIPKEVSIETELRSIDDLDELYSILRKNDPNIIHIAQNLSYLKWRVFTNPILKYKQLCLYRRGKLIAYCLFTDAERNSVRISDFCFKDQESGELVIIIFKRLMIEKDVNEIFIMGNCAHPILSKFFRTLTDYGFRFSRGTPFVLKPITESESNDLFNLNRWYITGIWTEGFNW